MSSNPDINRISTSLPDSSHYSFHHQYNLNLYYPQDPAKMSLLGKKFNALLGTDSPPSALQNIRAPTLFSKANLQPHPVQPMAPFFVAGTSPNEPASLRPSSHKPILQHPSSPPAARITTSPHHSLPPVIKPEKKKLTHDRTQA